MATEGKKVVKAGIGYTIGNYLMKGLNFFTIPLFAYLLTKGDYGKFGTFGAYEGILYVLLGAAIHTSYKNARLKYGLISEGINAGEDYHTFVSDTMIFILISTAGFLLVANLFANRLGRLLDLDRVSLNLLVVYCAASAVINCFNMDTSLTYQYGKYLAVALSTAVATIGISLVLIKWVMPNDGYMGRVIGTVAPISVAAVCIIISYFRRMPPKMIGSRLKWALRYSLPIVPHGISQVVLNQFDRIMIRRMIGDVESGIYSFAYNVYTIVQVTATSMDTVWGPWFYEKRKEEDYDSIKEYSNLFILILFAICSVVILLSPEVVLLLGRSKYKEAEYCVIPIVAAGFFACLYFLPANIEYYHAKTKSIAAATTSAAILNIVLNYFFIRKFGYIAAAYTTLATYILYFVFHYSIAWKIEGKSLFSNGIILIACVAVLALTGFTVFVIHQRVLRILVAVFLFVVLICFEEKRFKGIRLFINKRRKHSRSSQSGEE